MESSEGQTRPQRLRRRAPYPLAAPCSQWQNVQGASVGKIKCGMWEFNSADSPSSSERFFQQANKVRETVLVADSWCVDPSFSLSSKLGNISRSETAQEKHVIVHVDVY